MIPDFTTDPEGWKRYHRERREAPLSQVGDAVFQHSHLHPANLPFHLNAEV